MGKLRLFQEERRFLILARLWEQEQSLSWSACFIMLHDGWKADQCSHQSTLLLFCISHARFKFWTSQRVALGQQTLKKCSAGIMHGQHAPNPPRIKTEKIFLVVVECVIIKVFWFYLAPNFTFLQRWLKIVVVWHIGMWKWRVIVINLFAPLPTQQVGSAMKCVATLL